MLGPHSHDPLLGRTAGGGRTGGGGGGAGASRTSGGGGGNGGGAGGGGGLLGNAVRGLPGVPGNWKRAWRSVFRVSRAGRALGSGRGRRQE